MAVNVAAIVKAAKIAAKLAGIAIREKLRRNFQKWNRGETGKKRDEKSS